MIWVCGWCKPGERPVKEIEPLEIQLVSHGMCARHEEEWRKQIEILRAQRAAQNEVTA